MSTTQQMGSARRRAIPGMAASGSLTRPESPAVEQRSIEASQEVPAAGSTPPDEPRSRPPRSPEKPVRGTGRAADYGATQLANFRLPVDVLRRYQSLVRESEERHPRLRKQSLTEVVIALLEEGPETADEIAELIRRKRLAENAED